MSGNDFFHMVAPTMGDRKLSLVKQIHKSAGKYLSPVALFMYNTDRIDSAIDIIFELCKLYKEKE